MGTLIILLVLVVHQARVQADTVSEETEATLAEKREQARLDKEEFEWRSDVLATQRGALTKTLSDKRLELSHLEDHIRRLQEKLKSFVRQAQSMQDTSTVSLDELTKLEAERNKLTAALEQAKKDLEAAKEAADNRKPSYAIVPFKGRNGTHRKPIYIECLGDRIVIRPGGIELSARDFQGALGPGNPLDAVLRAIREYWVRHGVTDENTEPYPLLVVRPAGTQFYGAAREAMKAWDDEFGYELVGADMNIAFPAADSELYSELNRVVRLARQRQKLLSQAMPSRYRGGGAEAGLVAKTRGGFAVSGSHDPQSSRDPFGLSAKKTADGTEAGSSDNEQNAGDDSNVNQKRQQGNSSNQNADPTQQAAGNGQLNLRPLAGARGKNWAKPTAGNQNAATVTRPISIVCNANQLTILPDVNVRRSAVTIPWDADPAKTIDRFASSLNGHIESWGVAFSGGNWNPVLKVEVIAGGETRFQQLKVLLEDSGLGVEKR
jgi:archaellum component FlaC